jgi:hypothetical protein
MLNNKVKKQICREALDDIKWQVFYRICYKICDKIHEEKNKGIHIHSNSPFIECETCSLNKIYTVINSVINECE